MFFDTGMRNSEMCELKLTDIRNSYIHILWKGKKVRFVPMRCLDLWFRVYENCGNSSPKSKVHNLLEFFRQI